MHLNLLNAGGRSARKADSPQVEGRDAVWLSRSLASHSQRSMASGAVVGAPRSVPAGGWGVSKVLSSDPSLVTPARVPTFVARRGSGAYAFYKQRSVADDSLAETVASLRWGAAVLLCWELYPQRPNSRFETGMGALNR